MGEHILSANKVIQESVAGGLIGTVIDAAVMANYLFLARAGVA